MKSPQPWVPFYPSDWLAGTRGMSAVETGVYITLLMTMYERGEPIPRDDARMARLCGLALPTFRKVIATLMAEGKLSEQDGRLWNSRAAVELKKREEISEAARQSAASRWAKKTNQINVPDDADAMPRQSDRNANHNHNKNTPIGPKGQKSEVDLSGMSREIRGYAEMGINREAALAVRCQHCQAQADAACVGANGQERTSPHIERYQLVAKLREPAKSSAAALPFVRQDDPLVPFLAKVRGKEIIFGDRGSVTATPDEIAAAKALAGAA